MTGSSRRIRRTLIVLASLAFAVPFTTAAANGAGDNDDHGQRLAWMTGAREVPGPGDPDGRGPAEVTLRDSRVCFELRWRDIAPPTAAHIHAGMPGVAGPVVVPLFATAEGTTLPPTVTGVQGCVAADPGLVRAIRQHPWRYYVNVHNQEYPAGAIRGQLHRAHDD